MKRIGNIYGKIISIDNLMLADEKARKGKTDRYGVKLHNKNRSQNIQSLHLQLRDKTYKTSKYETFKIFEPKERLVYRLPYFPDRITHHAIMNILEPVFVSNFTADTYSCIKGRGIHGVFYKMRDVLKDIQGTKYCLKLDIEKFYPNIDHCTLKNLLRRKIKDNDLLWLLDEIIDSTDGIPIGNYLSQYFANFYLTYFDHWIKETKAVKYYFRYADDIVVLSGDKAYLHQIFNDIRNYLADELKLTVKSNYQVFPVESRGIDFVGYVFYHTHTRVRKSIKQNFARMLKRNPNESSTASYMGWLKHCNSKNLIQKLMNQFSDFNIKPEIKFFAGDKTKVENVLNTPIKVLDFKIEKSKQKQDTDYLTLSIEKNSEKRIIFTGASFLIQTIRMIPKDKFPFITTIRKDNGYYEFT